MVICLPNISKWSGHYPLTPAIKKTFSPRELRLTGCFLCFTSLSVNPKDGCVWKSQQISSFCNTQTSHQHPCHIQSQLNHISSSLWCSVWTSAGLLTISAWLNAVSHRHVIDQAVLFAGLQIFMLTVVSELAFLTSFYRKRKYIRGQMYTRHKSQEVLWQTLSDE